MGGKMDQAKGRLKEAGGALTGNERLKREGRLDQAARKVKEAMFCSQCGGKMEQWRGLSAHTV